MGFKKMASYDVPCSRHIRDIDPLANHSDSRHISTYWAPGSLVEKPPNQSNGVATSGRAAFD